MVTREGAFFGTRVRVSVPDAGTAAFVTEACARYEKLFNRFLPGSDIWRLNHAGGRWTDVDPETAAIVTLSERLRVETGGAFNICMGRLSTLWREQASGTEIDAAAALARRATVEIRAGRARIPAGVEADLGGVAKGYICDSLARRLRRRGVKSALLDLGGNIYALGGKEDGGPWTVGLRDPNGGRGDILCALEARDVSVVTSGAYERGFFRDGVFRHHILDPASGAPARNGLLSVTVVSPGSAPADAWATAFSVLDVEESRARLRENPELEALFISESGRWLATPGLTLLVENREAKGDNL